MTAITQIAVEAIHPNTYNPNALTAEEFAELVAEVKHLGRLPKPVIVRPNGAGYVIVDGEHGWRAARETGLAEIPCEIVDVDDFEAMRQTYKRNQHGTHNPVRLGEMFAAMMRKRDLSQRELAEEMEVSEGNVRNALEYAKAAGLRNDYAEKVTALNVRQVRYLNRLPRAIANPWLVAGADIELVGVSLGDDPDDKDSTRYWTTKHTLEELEKLAESGLFEYVRFGYGADGFKRALRTVHGWAKWEGQFCYAGLNREAVRPYTKHYFDGVFYVHEEGLAEVALRTIFDASTNPPSFVLSPIEFESVIKQCGTERSSHTDFIARLELAIFEKTGRRRPKSNLSVKDQLAAIELAGTPDWVQSSRLSHVDRLRVWQALGPAWKKRDLMLNPKLGDNFAADLKRASEEDQAAIVMNEKSKDDMADDVAALVADRFKHADMEFDLPALGLLVAHLRNLRREELIVLTDAFSWRDSLTSLKRVQLGEAEAVVPCKGCGNEARVIAAMLASPVQCPNCQAVLEVTFGNVPRIKDSKNELQRLAAALGGRG